MSLLPPIVFTQKGELLKLIFRQVVDFGLLVTASDSSRREEGCELSLIRVRAPFFGRMSSEVFVA